MLGSILHAIFEGEGPNLELIRLGRQVECV